MRKHFAQRIVYKGMSKECGILKVGITKKILSNMKKSWRFAKAAEAGSKERQTVVVKFRGERKRIIKEIRDVQAAKKIARSLHQK